MDDIRTPQAHHFILPLLFGVVLFVWAWNRTPSTFTLVLMAVSGVLAFWFLMNVLHWLSAVLGEASRQRREMEFKFTENYRWETVSRMNDTQIKAVRAGRHIIEIMPGENGPVEKLAGVECYLYTAWFILVNSTELHVYPINRFQAGTYHFDVLGDMAVDDYRQAKNFHSWMYINRYGMWGKGNTSMSWSEGVTADKVLEALGLERDTYKETD
jgi:hypothetical protein